ncbi:MAG: hypothetical protein ACKN9K_25015 [Dolichospermum sp.]
MGWASCPPVVYLITPESAVVADTVVMYSLFAEKFTLEKSQLHDYNKILNSNLSNK